MHRPYTPDHYRQLIGTLHTDFPDAALGADVMVGFPGETTQNFLNTLNLIKDLPLTYLHVFPFSPRTGTVASRLPNRVTGAELKRRSKALQDISMLKKIAYSQRFIGRSIAVLPEQEIEPGWWQGTSPNYLKINFATSDHLRPGIPVYVKLTHVEDQILWGTTGNVVQ
jgi:threonylcarbamoyladenosine tRNA methylthiotransferase MtaB